tara:strand:- start:2349 stop:2765 length:417 start_codon:yes stop_codon:yes gene_type:complete
MSLTYDTLIYSLNYLKHQIIKLELARYKKKSVKVFDIFIDNLLLDYLEIDNKIKTLLKKNNKEIDFDSIFLLERDLPNLMLTIFYSIKFNFQFRLPNSVLNYARNNKHQWNMLISHNNVNLFGRPTPFPIYFGSLDYY